MPIPVTDNSNNRPDGLAAFLKLSDEENGKGIRGALFLVDSYGRPVEFYFSRINLVSQFLWREGEARRSSVTALVRALFESTEKLPIVILCLSDEIPPKVFSEDLLIEIPACRISTGGITAHSVTDKVESLDESTDIFWVNNEPMPESHARLFLESLDTSKLILEPFSRAQIGLDEAFAAGTS